MVVRSKQQIKRVVYTAGYKDSIFTLTAGVNEYVGTDGNDTFNAAVGTFTNNTSIDGKDGKDTLNAEFASNLTTGPALKSVEVVNLTNLAGGERSVNTANFDGVEQINSVDSAGAVRLDNLASTDVEFGIKGGKGGLDLRFTSDALEAAGEDAAVTLTLDAVEGGTVAIGPQSLLAEGGVATLNINSTGDANELDKIRDSRAADQTLTTINIYGDQDLKLGAVEAPVELINAADSTANLDVNVGDLNDDLSVVGGQGGKNTVRGNVVVNAETGLTNVQNLDLTFTDGMTFDAINTNTAAKYTLKGTGPSIDNIVAGSTFTANALAAGAAASNFSFAGLGDFELTTTTRATGAAAVVFGGIDFTNVRNVSVTSDNTAATTLGALDLGDLGQSVTLVSNNTGDLGATGTMDITVGTDNVFAQTLTLTANNEGDVFANDYTANRDLTATLTAKHDGDVTANDLTSTAGAVTVTAETTKAGGGDATINDITADTKATVTANAARDTIVTIGDVAAAKSGIAADLTAKAGTATVAGGAIAVGDFTATKGNVVLNATAEAFATIDDGSGGGKDITATAGAVTYTANAANGATVEFADIAAKSGATITLDNAAGSATGLVANTINDVTLSAKGNIVLDITNAAYGTATANDLTVVDGTAEVIINNAAAGSALAAATTAVNDITSTKGNVTVDITNAAYNTATVNDLALTEGNAVIAISAGRDTITTVNDVATADGNVTVDIATTTTGSQTFTTLATGDLAGDKVSIAVVANGGTVDLAGSTGSANTITANAAANTGRVITAELSGSAKVEMGALIVTSAAGNSTLINAESLKGGLEVTVSDAQDTIVLGSGADEITFGALTDSLLANYDKVLGFDIANDTLVVGSLTIDNTSTGTQVVTLGTVDSLSATDIATAVNGNLAVDEVGYFTYGSQKFLVINDGVTATFGANDDAIIEVTGLVGAIGDLYFA